MQCRWTWRWGSLEGRTGLPAEVSKAPSLSEETDTLSPTDAASSPSFLLTLVSLLVGFRPLSVSPLSLGPTLEVGVQFELWNLKNLIFVLLEN